MGGGVQTIVQNEPLALSAVLRGIGEALTELETLSSSARATYVIEVRRIWATVTYLIL